MYSQYLKLFVFSIFFINAISTCIFASELEKHIELFSPSGGEKLKGGNIYEIKWKASIPSSTVSLKLWDGVQSKWSTIAHDVPTNQGTYSWVVPFYLQGDRFRIRVQGENTHDVFEMSSTYFDVEPLTKEPKKESTSLAESLGLSVAPNPFTHGTNIQFTLPVTGIIEVIITDAVNRIVEHHSKTFTSGYHNIEINTLEWLSGSYFCNFRYMGEQETILMNHIR